MSRLALAGLILLGACTTMNEAEAQSVVLFRAKIESVSEVPERPSDVGQLDLATWFKVNLGAVEPLIGQIGARQVEVQLKIAALPKADRLKDIYVIGEERPDGKIQVLKWDYALSGLCVGHDMAKTYGIESNLMSLRKAGRVKWNADCDW